MRRVLHAFIAIGLPAAFLGAGTASAATAAIPASTIVHRVAALYGEHHPHILRLQQTRTDSTPNQPMYYITLSGHFREGAKRAVTLSFSALADRSYVWGVSGQDAHHHTVWLDRPAVASRAAPLVVRYRPRPTPTPIPTPSPTPTGTGTSSGYTGAAAAAYADTYWSSYNATYPSFANSGGDCTNFVSQALHAGGIAFRLPPAYTGNAAWYITKTNGTWSYSVPWVNANSNNVFLQNTLHVTVVASYYGLAPGQTVTSGAAQGDVILYDWNNDGTYDHEAIVVTPDGQYVDAHTNNRYHAYWTLAPYNSSWATTRITVLHITAGTT